MIRRLFALALALSCTYAVAAEATGKAEAAIRARLAATLKGTEITSVTASPVPGLYEVVLDGAETAFVSADGAYLVSGDLYQATPGKGLVNLTEQRRETQRSTALGRVADDQMITFAAQGKEKAAVYVFTDVDCGYCRKMHQEVPRLNAAGVTVHYLAFPRAGTQGDTARKMNAVWCAADPRKAMTDAKRGSNPPPAAGLCRSPVADQYKLGLAMGVRGTPAVFTASGEQLGGYVPADELVQELLTGSRPAR